MIFRIWPLHVLFIAAIGSSDFMCCRVLANDIGSAGARVGDPLCTFLRRPLFPSRTFLAGLECA